MLGDINDVVSVNVEKCRADQLCGPNLQQMAILIEYLDTIILAIRDLQPPAPIDPNAMRQIELTRRGARFTPRKHMFPLG
jgi:hypothetical protein